MGFDDVYVNGRSALHKGSGGKSIAAMPDVCKCPPPPPAGPVPTPLPNNAMASDLQDGAPSVLIDGNPVGTSKSHLGTSTGNEVSKPTGGNLINGATKGKAYPKSYSMDVKAEGNPIWRHLDTATHNHASDPAGTPPWPAVAKMSQAVCNACANDAEDPCKLTPHDSKCPPDKDGNPRYPHHLMPARNFLLGGKANEKINKSTKNPAHTEAMKAATCQPGCEGFRYRKAPCICVAGMNSTDTKPDGTFENHGRIHRRQDLVEAKVAIACAANGAPGTWSFPDARDTASKAAQEVTGCSAACLAAQLDEHYTNMGIDVKNQRLRAVDAVGPDNMKDFEDFPDGVPKVPGKA